MVIKSEIEKILTKYFNGDSDREKLQRAVEEIAGMESDWEEVQVREEEMGYTVAVDCTNICWMADQVVKGEDLRFFRRKRHEEVFIK